MINKSIKDSLWEIELDDKGKILIKSSIDDIYLIVNEDDCKKDGDFVFLSNSFKEKMLEDMIFKDREVAVKEFNSLIDTNRAKSANSTFDKQYQEYVARAKEGYPNEWEDIILSKDEFIKLEKKRIAQEKVRNYVNEKLYEINTPYCLRDRKQFVCWDYEWNEDREGYIKVPKNPLSGKNALSNNSNTWSDFKTACEAVDKYEFKGIGIMFDKGLMGIDIDHCFDGTKEDKSKAQYIIETINSYTELSPSGTGVHILAFGKIPDKCYKRKNDIEIYSTGRFFTLTGNNKLFIGKKMRKAADTQEGINKIVKEYMQREEKPDIKLTQNIKTLEDDKIIDKIKNGKGSEKFDRLYNKGDYSEFASQGESGRHIGDISLCSLIAYYTDDKLQIDRIFRSSALMRDKWDELRGVSTYGEMTIDEALRRRSNKYDDNYAKKMAIKKRIEKYKEKGVDILE